MNTMSLSRRDRAVLTAIDAGRCLISGPGAGALTVDGMCCADQFVGARLAAAGLIDRPVATGPSPARLTTTGRALLAV